MSHGHKSHGQLVRLAFVSLALAWGGGSARSELGSAWWEASGAAAHDHLGWAVAGVADLDGDGLGDVIVGAPDHDEAGRANCGAVHVLSGSDGSLLWAAYGDTAGDLFGQAVAGTDDLDGDGLGDVIVGAPRDDHAGGRTDAGSAYAFSGATGLLLWSAAGDTAGDLLGSSVAGVPDLDGDAIPDVLVGAPDDDVPGLTNVGCAYVRSGATGTLLWKASGTGNNDHLGAAVGGLPDVDGDGLGEVIVGVPDDDLPGKNNAGSVHLLSGVDGALLWTTVADTSGDRLGAAVAGVADLGGAGQHGVVAGAPLDDAGGLVNSGSALALAGADGSTQWSIGGAAANDNLGLALAGGLDVDADGFGDVLVGAPLAQVGGQGGAGRLLVCSGADGSVLWQAQGGSAGDALGRSVASVPDVDGDGRADVAVGASGVDAGGLTDAGRATVYATQAVTLDVTAPTVSCPADLVLEATGPGGAVGTFVVGVTDDVDPLPTLTCSPASGSTFPLGTTVVTCEATDAAGNTGRCSFTVTVVDTTAPEFHASTGATSLWPPNHQMLDVGLTIAAADGVDAAPTVTVEVLVDEPADADEADAALDGAALALRATRDGTGDGRVYLLVVRASDASGNASLATSAVVVPKSKSAAHVRAAHAQAQAALAAVVASGGSAPKGFVTTLPATKVP